MAALTLQQFEYLKNTENPRLYAIRHPHSQVNERYIYVFVQRKAKGYTQQKLADMLGVSQVMISRWENGEENFTVATLAKISAALEMEISNPLKPAA